MTATANQTVYHAEISARTYALSTMGEGETVVAERGRQSHSRRILLDFDPLITIPPQYALSVRNEVWASIAQAVDSSRRQKQRIDGVTVNFALVVQPVGAEPPMDGEVPFAVPTRYQCEFSWTDAEVEGWLTSLAVRNDARPPERFCYLVGIIASDLIKSYREDVTHVEA